MANSIHPAAEQLRAFALGRLSATESAAIESHLLACQQCCDVLAGSDDHDAFQARLQAAAPSGGATPPDQERPATHRTPPPAANEPEGVPQELRDHPRYRVLGVLGSGGMGTVFKAEHRLLERPVVIKVLRPDLVCDAELRERFRREARLAAKLAHPNVVAVYEAEQVGPSPLLVMEFVDGQTLADLLRTRGPLPVPVACELVRQAAQGLQHLHERGLVHRDIKPGNLIATGDGH